MKLGEFLLAGEIIILFLTPIVFGSIEDSSRMSTGPPRLTSRCFVQRGFSIIELLLVFAVVAVVVALALPAYQNYTIRSRVAQALLSGSEVKLTITRHCDHNARLNLNKDVLDRYVTDFLASVTVVGGCASPVITVKTKNTGAKVDPVLELTRTSGDQSGMSYECRPVKGISRHIPASCKENALP